MKGRKILLAFIISAVTLTSGCANGTPKTEEAKSEQKTTEENAVVPIKPLTEKAIDDNPYMAKSDANIHHDCYNSDTTDEVLPVDIYPEINVSYETVNKNASPAVFFDTYGHAVVPLQGGLAIRDINADEAQTEGYFSPAKHDGGGYVIQSSYSFVDESNRLVCPTSNNHVLMLKATDDAGNVLPEFEKVLDIDIKAAAEEITGKTLDQNLLSVVFDYEGNLWFATGGFRIYPERKQQGAMGYISREAIDAILKGENVDLKESTFVYELEPGEGAENGIASSKEGAVILTNQKCYLLNAKDGVQVQWCTSYESVGAKDSKEGDETTGGGLAWGGGCSPSLTSKLVMFTDNQDPVNLLALDMKTGEIVASMPVIDELPENMQVSVENSAMVYDNGEGTVSTIVCNWFGAGSAKLADADNDSSIQTYENIYDVNWLKQGNKMVLPGVERVDTIKTKDGYKMKSIWCRDDIHDTSMMKLSTATGYIYGYVQDMESGMWQFIMLDFETGETAFTMDVSDKPGYNNMAIGMYAGNSGNTLYCPTGYLELLRLQDRFVYLPEMPYRKVDLDKAKRNVLTQEEFTEAGGKGNVAGWLNTITVENVHPNTTVAIRMKGIAGEADTFTLYAYDKENKLKEVPAELWHIQEEDKTVPDKLTEDTLYEVHVMVEDGGEFDLSDTEKEIKIAVILGK
ncbi:MULTISPECIES: hypothetical protein [Clostridia]|uniref:hypothetical protein n=1 Tax=Clostridia TaxID=186801 RepID=UPI000E4FA29E|nr:MULTISPECIES: hypothetical protein [Clostridia]RGH39660.1 hypothetical protein DW901_07290 [Firmicutes bacterium AM41-5BH]RHV05967.1 hypothetical protein DXB97_05935 [Firmicutes bacterium OM07-11]RKQ28763.1 hypothetical protein D8Q48_08725 [Ruminococcus sp. B05]TAP33671.1 hypothetical protein EYA86_07250 [Mediterraneibacter sp. gm002]